MWYNIIKQDNFNYHIPLSAYGDEVVTEFSNFSMGFTDSLHPLRELLKDPVIKKRRNKLFRKLVNAIFYKIYSEIINSLEIGTEIRKDEFYEKAFLETRKYTITYDKVQFRGRSKKLGILTGKFDLNTFVTMKGKNIRWESYIKYSPRTSPIPISDLVRSGYIESLSATDAGLGETHRKETGIGVQTYGRKMRTLERVAYNSFIIRRHIPDSLYLDKLRPFMGSTAPAPTNRSGTIWTVKD